MRLTTVGTPTLKCGSWYLSGDRVLAVLDGKEKWRPFLMLLGGIAVLGGGVAVLASRAEPKPMPKAPEIQCIKAPCELSSEGSNGQAQ